MSLLCKGENWRDPRQDDYDNTSHDADIFAKKMIAKYGQCQAVCESTGNMWIKTYEAFEKNDIPIILTNPLKTRR